MRSSALSTLIVILITANVHPKPCLAPDQGVWHSLNRAMSDQPLIDQPYMVKQTMTLSAFPKTWSNILAGTAVPADIFILLETPQPWSKPALLSEGVPESVRQVIKPLLESTSRVRVHLIANEQTPHQIQRRILIYRRAGSLAGRTANLGLGSRLARDYEGWEIQAETPEAMAPALTCFLHEAARAQQGEQWQIRSLADDPIRHLMICTHASHNECCGIYGYPFYQAAIAHIQQLGLTQYIQPWQISHIGGHRFAPTLIDFPQGRYYGNLDEDSLQCLLKQRGAIAPLFSTYRGWSLLPKPLQILEAELFRQYGWEWLHSRVAGRILNQNETHKQFWVELWVESAKQPLHQFTAEIRQNIVHSYQLESDVEDDLASLIRRKTG